MIRLYECLRHEHDWRLVIIAALICLISSYAASLKLVRTQSRTGFARVPWLLLLSVVVGFGIWATHFVAMLAYEPSVGFSFDLVQTFLSLLIITGISIPAFSLMVLTRQRYTGILGAALLGLGISAMHYSGMYGLLPTGFMVWDNNYLAVSVISGVVFTIAAIETHRILDGFKAQFAFAGLFTLAICATHFFGMSALTLLPLSEADTVKEGISPMVLGALIGAIAIVLLQIGIVVAVLDSWIWQKREENAKRNREAEMLLGSIADLVKMGAWSYDVKAATPYWSKQLLDIHNLDKEDKITLERAASYFEKAGTQEFLDAIDLACDTGVGFDREWLYKSWDDQEVWMRVVCEPIIENGETTKLIGAYQDVSPNKIERKKLSAAVEEAGRANKLKSEFLATMSHELRTPMNGVLGMAQVLEGTDLDEKQKQLVDILLVSGNSLLAIISDILDISRIESGLLEIHNSDYDPKALIQDAVASVSGIAVQKDLSLTYETRGTFEETYSGDDLRIRQVLINFLGNALKFTEKGRVKLLLNAEPKGGLGFYVIDSGPGIPADKQEEIFKPFTQADGSTTRKHGGTGLGLSISRDLVELMGGTLGVKSVVGKGSVFWFKLPGLQAVFGATSKVPAPSNDTSEISPLPTTKSIARQIESLAS